MKKSRKWKKSFFENLMIMPALIFILVFLAYPLCQGIAYAFTNYKFIKPNATKFIGIQNFIRILSADKKFYSFMSFTFLYSIGIALIAFALAFFLAQLLNKAIPGRGIMRGLILLPWIVSNSVTGVSWKWILNDRYGIVNKILLKLGLIQEPILFFAREQWARFIVILVGIWKVLPFMTIAVLAGLQSIPREYYEAASIDGAGRWSKIRYITLPGIRSVSIMSILLEFMWTFNNFESIYLLTGGGPNERTYTLPIYIYDVSFIETRIGYGSAVAVINMLIISALTVIVFGVRRAAENGSFRKERSRS